MKISSSNYLNKKYDYIYKFKIYKYCKISIKNVKYKYRWLYNYLKVFREFLDGSIESDREFKDKSK